MYIDNLLAGKRILITGGGTGLGKATAQRMSVLGAELFICGRREEVLNRAAEEIEAVSARPVQAIPCDIRDPAAISAMMDTIWADAPLDALINNAAANFLSPTESLSPRAFDAIMKIGLYGAAYCTIECGKRWIEEEDRGVIVDVLTTGAVVGRPFTVPLTMAKAALLAMIRSLAVEWGPKGIRTVGVAPGIFPTPGASEQLHLDDRYTNDVSAIPVGRFGRLDEWADLLTYLVSDQAGYLNGEMITIDGGRSLKGLDVDDLFGWTDEMWAASKAGRKR